MKYKLHILRIRWINRHFTREINAQLAQYRMYKKLLSKTVDLDDIEFYEYEMVWYYHRISERTGRNPDKMRRFRIR